jgi:predicted nucleic acid-binding protein
LLGKGWSMSAKKIPDTNVILRYLLADSEEQYQEVLPFFSELRDGRQRAIIPGEVMLETFYVLNKVYSVPPKEAAGALKDLLLYKGVKNRKLLIESLRRFVETPGISLLDCFLWVKAETCGCQLLTFDNRLRKVVGG